ncbi:hypothetical protein EYM_02230 [Ignicoccus islandicus DSM 13165]|uniref:Uncharacterized protein n=1 Tax=Ignicoccus islandicus DSM 13165 TaxID=940295 RepID=A0A0U3FS36_9CREN|nr:hypothetical protein [Ignicoccus islandicus]ALU12304.1 hypothetical protein EYM_02230 [Ignicoccus islandicus DSM 13165]
MKFECIAAFTSKSPSKTYNEDQAICTDYLAAVIDGASPLVNDLQAKLRTRWLVDEIVSELISLKGDLRSGLNDLIDSLRSKYELKFGFPSNVGKYELPSAAASITKLNAEGLEYAVFADSPLVITFKGGGEKVITDDSIKELDQVVVNRIEELMAEGLSFNEALKEVRPILRKNREMMCIGYSVIAPLGECKRNFIYGKMNLESVEYLALMSDGMARLVDTYGFFRSYREMMLYGIENGFGDLLRILREIEREDEGVKVFKRVSVYDDASLVVLRPSP